MSRLMSLLHRETYGFPSNKTVYDAAGSSLHLWAFDDKLTHPCGEKSIREVKELELRDDDVILCGYPKTGCHWAWEILCKIVKHTAEPSTDGKAVAYFEMAPFELLDSLPSPRIFNTHLWFDYLPKQVTEKNTKLIFTVRNPKDTAVSFYNHHISLFDLYGYKGEFNNWFELYMKGEVDYGSFCDYYLDLDNTIRDNPGHPILIVYYEDMKKDLPNEIRKMCAYLGVSLDEQLIEAIANSSGFEVMKKEFIESNKWAGKLIRKGQVGEWKSWLTVAQSECIDDAVEKKLTGTCFKFRYSLDN